MPSLSDQWKGAKAAWDDDTSPDSPGSRFGLMFDPLAYMLGDKYRDFINKTGDESNRSLSHWMGTDDRNGWVSNKPASTIGMIIGGAYAGGGMFGGGGAGAGGGAGSAGGSGVGWGGAGTSNSGLGLFANGGSGGMAGVGGGNAGMFASQGGIAGGAGIGAATEGGAAGSMDWQQLAKDGMQNQQPQQEQTQRDAGFQVKQSNPAFMQASVTPGQPITYQQRLARVLRYA